MRKLNYIILFAVIISLHSCCSSQQFSENPPLENTEWSLIGFGPFMHEPNAWLDYFVPPEKRPEFSLTFSNGEFSGKGICNFYSGRYNISKDSISFKEILITERLCEYPELEQKYFNTLKDVVQYKIKDNMLFLFVSNKDSVSITFEPLSK